MRLPFPERISLTGAIVFATILCSIEQLQGTSRIFSICAFLFIVLATIAFNLAGGFTRSTGAYVFFYSFGVIAGITGKAYLGEAADTNLLVPELTMEVFLGGIAAMLVAVFIARKLTRKTAFLQNLVKTKDMQNATIGAMVTGFAIQFLSLALPRETGSVLSALNQINRFLPMAIILGTIHEITKTKGRKSTNIFVFAAGGMMFLLNGLVFFSKEGMFTPFLCWAIAAGSMRFKVRPYQIAVGALVVYSLVHYFVPYAQLGRNALGDAEDQSMTHRIAVSFSLMTHIGEVRQTFEEGQTAASDEGATGYYQHPQGLLDRLEILTPDDALINATERGKPFGLSPVPLLFLNLIPHIFYPNKPNLSYGNLYAREIGGIISDEDVSTGISFSPSGDGYHMAKWVGVLLVAPILWIMLFVIFDSLCGDVRQSPWGLLMISLYAHAAPEGMLGYVIYMMGFTTIGLVVAAYSAAYVMPVIGTLLFGPEKTGLHLRKQFTSFQQRQAPAAGPPAAATAAQP